jgi:predicted metalloprotease
MEWEGREESENVEDRRGMGGLGGMGGGTKIGIAGGGIGIIVVIVAMLLGVDPSALTNIVGGGGGDGGGGQQVAPNQPYQESPEEKKLAHFTKVIFGDTERVWDKLFQKMGKTYKKPKLVLFSGQVQSACGRADASVGPFYCPGDHNVYIDLSFYRDMETKLDAPGEFPRAYVIAHEVGHHVQLLLGYSDRKADHHSVRLELQADYLAGVWAHHGQEQFKFLQKGDLEQAVHAAFEIGDDRLQKKATGQVRPDTFTHGTSKQRQAWFLEGYKTGSVEGAEQLFTLPYSELMPPH